MDGLTDGQRGTCVHCGRAIVWHFDRDEDGSLSPAYGFWLDAEHMTEVCGGSAGDDDIWHEIAAV